MNKKTDLQTSQETSITKLLQTELLKIVILLHTRHNISANDDYIKYVSEEIYTLFFKDESSSSRNKRFEIIKMGSLGYFGEKHKISVALIGSWINPENKGKL